MAEASQHNYYNPAEASSIPVDNVQELAEIFGSQHDVPPRYIRPEAETEPVVDPGAEQIPVIELCRLIDPQLSVEESAKLKFAFEEWGFFRLINHGVPEEVMNQMNADKSGFFKLPLEQKKLYAHHSIGDTLDKYSSELKKVAGILHWINLMANELNLNPEILLNVFKDQPQGLRMNYYPPYPKADTVLGISPHTDATGFTLLLQVS